MDEKLNSEELEKNEGLSSEDSEALGSQSEEAENKQGQYQEISQDQYEDANVTEDGNEAYAEPERYSEVAGITGNKKIAIAVVMSLALGILIFIFMPETKTPTQVKEEKKAELQEKKDEIIKTATPVSTVKLAEKDAFVPTIKTLVPPPIKDPKPPAPPPAPEASAPTPPAFPTSGNSNMPSFPTKLGGNSSSTSLFGSSEEEETRKRALEARRKSSIMVVGGGSSGEGGILGQTQGKDAEAETEKSKAKNPQDFLGFGEGALNEQALAKTSSAQISATYIGRLDSTIAQGKIIHAVMETAINSDLPGTLRAIVSRDVYAEAGKSVLIPKGSRVIGTYSVELKPGQSRVNVAWDRLIRPDGIDLALASPGTDSLGRAGVGGFVDDKILTKLANAFMVSYIIPKLANALSNVDDKAISTTSTTGTDGSVSTTTNGGTTASAELKESADQFKEIATKALEDSFNAKPTIYVDQGTKINIFVNKDIVFPPQIALKSFNKNLR